MVLKMNLGAMLSSCFMSSRARGHSQDQLPRGKRQKLRNHNSSSAQRISLCDISDPGSPLSVNDLSNSLIGSNLHIFTLAELKLITHDFSSSNFVGEGGFGPVYKGFVDERIRPGLKAQPVAVKLLDLDGSQGYREWMTEVIFLGQLRHQHLVKLIGYCCEGEHRLLVYEYVARGNLENQLFRRYSIALPWLTRIKIALGAAKGLAFLHGDEKPVIYRDFKSSNVLLDSDYTAKLSDFGLAKDGPEGDDTHVTTRVMGTHGYAAPEYIMTGHLTTMSDVYSFGVVLLELVSGKRAVDKSRPGREQVLVEWARPLLRDHYKIDKIVDSRLDGQYSSEGAKKAAALACQCLSHHAKCRPTMDGVVKELEEILGIKKDIPVEPFVYIVPPRIKTMEGAAFFKPKTGHVRKEEEERNLQKKKKKNGSNRNGHMQRQLRMRSPGIYSDTALYKKITVKGV